MARRRHHRCTTGCDQETDKKKKNVQVDHLLTEHFRPFEEQTFTKNKPILSDIIANTYTLRVRSKQYIV